MINFLWVVLIEKKRILPASLGALQVVLLIFLLMRALFIWLSLREVLGLAGKDYRSEGSLGGALRAAFCEGRCRGGQYPFA